MPLFLLDVENLAEPGNGYFVIARDTGPTAAVARYADTFDRAHLEPGDFDRYEVTTREIHDPGTCPAELVPDAARWVRFLVTLDHRGASATPVDWEPKTAAPPADPATIPVPEDTR